MSREKLSLDSLGIQFDTDKSSIGHNYLSFYETFFAPHREKPLKFLEIGVFNGASLAVWEAYFQNAEIVGVDINPSAKKYARERVKIEIADQSNIDDLTTLALQNGPFDIIVEDGSHKWEHQITTLRTLFPFVKNGGIYIVEDLQTNYGGLSSEYRGVASISCMEYLKRIVDLRVADDQVDVQQEEDAFIRTYARSMEFMAFYQRSCLIKKNHRKRAGIARISGEYLIKIDSDIDSVPVELGLHVGNLGDVASGSGSFKAGKDHQNIQGLSIASAELPKTALRYRVQTSDGGWSEWAESDAFIGSRGRGHDLTGVSVELADQFRDTHNIRVIGAFRDGGQLVMAGSGERCVAHGQPRPLYGLQVIVNRARAIAT